jgi:site-specific DNA-methyltransferase (adenine-specific)
MIESECLFEKEDPTSGQRLILGDCLDVLKSMDANTFTAVVTDPPAGIAFMGKEWDKDKGGRDAWIAWMTGVAKECLRVCKPGAHALVWGLPRTSHWTATAWEDAGWEVRDRVAFAFGSGFPKSAAIDKHIDKKAGAVREVVGKAILPTLPAGADGGLWQGMGQPPHETCVTAPSTPDAKTWAGYGTALKPAVEDWWLLRKPIEKGLSIAENCVKHGTGALAIDNSRVDTKDTIIQSGDTVNIARGACHEGYDRPNATMFRTGKPKERGGPAHPSGRFPANLAHDSSPEVLAEFAKAGARPPTKPHPAYNKYLDPSKKSWRFKSMESKISDIGGSVARFFTSCPAESGDYPPFLYGAKAGRKEKEKGLTEPKCMTYWDDTHHDNNLASPNRYVREQKAIACSHPTVKSLSLMRWLCGLVKMPEYNLILDPFAGTGTTLIACKQLGMDAVGIEQSPEYVRIANLRIRAWK